MRPVLSSPIAGMEDAQHILRRIDQFKPLLVTPISELAAVEERLLNDSGLRASAATLEFQTCPVSKIGTFLPWPEAHWRAVIDDLQFQRSDRVAVVATLDVLTTLAVLLSGDIDTKAKYLFRWYNLNEKGMLEEEEHYLMLRRLGGCLRKLRFVGALDFSDAEVKFLAMKARVRTTFSGRQFLPGLNFEDFVNWIESSDECRGYFLFIEVLDRLVDMLRTLDARSEKLLEILRHKDAQASISMPAVDPGLLVAAPSAILSFKAPTLISLVIPCQADCPLSDPSIYVEVMEEFEVPFPLYGIDPNIISRHEELELERMEPDLRCCHKFYSTRTVQKAIASRRVSVHGSGGLQRVDVRGLRPGSRYLLTVQHDRWRYHALRVTPPNYDKHHSGVCILPASLSARLFVEEMDKSRGKFKDFTIVFTGQVCDIASSLRVLLSMLKDQCASRFLSPDEFEAFSSNTLKMLHRELHALLPQSLRKLQASVLASDGILRSSSTPFSLSPRQLVFYQGASPLLELMKEFESVIGPAAAQQLEALSERELQLHTLALAPPNNWIQVHHTRVFIGDGSSSTIVNGLIDSFTRRLHDCDFDASECVVLLVKSPSDLMFVKNPDNPDLEVLAEWSDPLEDHLVAEQHEPELRGKYELLHGEYSNRPTKAAPRRRDSIPAFQRLAELLFSFLISRFKMFPEASKSLIIVSCGWVEGANFELRRSHDGEEFTVSHISLLACGPKPRLLATIEQLLPTDVLYVAMPPTETRAVIFDVDGMKPMALSRPTTLATSASATIATLPASSICGPVQVVEVGTNAATISVEALGRGLLTLRLFNLPMGLDHETFKGLVCQGYDEHSGLLPAPMVRRVKWSAGRIRTFAFLLSGLLANGHYGVLVEADGGDRRICTLNTLPIAAPGVLSLLLCPVSWRDYSERTPRQQLLRELAALPRGPKGPLLTVFCDATAHEDLQPYAAAYPALLRGMLDLKEMFHCVGAHSIALERLTEPPLGEFMDEVVPPVLEPTVDLGASGWSWEQLRGRDIQPLDSPRFPIKRTVPVQSGVDLQIHGAFAVLTPRNAASHSLKATIDAVEHDVPRNHATVKHLVVIAPKPLVYALTRTPAEAFHTINPAAGVFPCQGNVFTNDGLSEECLGLVVRLFEGLLGWKVKQRGREVRIIGCAPVPALTTIIIGQPTLPLTSGSGGGSSERSPAELKRASSVLEELPGSAALAPPHDASQVASSSVWLSRSQDEPAMPISRLVFSTEQSMHYVLFPSHADARSMRPASDGDDPVAVEEESEPFMHLQPDAPIWLTATLCYEVLSIGVSRHLGVAFAASHLADWYPEVGQDPKLRHALAHSVVYRVDLLQRENLYVEMDDVEASSSDDALVGKGDTPTLMHVQEVVCPHDLFRIVLGPVLGMVTQHAARVLFEVNMNLPALRCSLTPYGAAPMVDDDEDPDGDEAFVVEVRDVRAYSPIVFTFAGLKPRARYEVRLPQVHKTRVLGLVQTAPQFVTSLDVLITGGRCFDNLGIVNDLVAQVAESQTPNLHHLDLLNAFAHREHREDSAQVLTQPSLWGLVGAHVRLPGAAPSVLFHLSAQTVLPSIMTAVLSALAQKSARLMDTAFVSGSSAVRELFLCELEEVVRDTVRALFTHPSCAFLLASFPNVFLHHSDYTMTSPASDMPAHMQVHRPMLQKMLRRTVGAYVSALHGEPISRNYFRQWSAGPIVFAVLDVVSGRLATASAPPAVAAPAVAAADPSGDISSVLELLAKKKAAEPAPRDDEDEEPTADAAQVEQAEQEDREAEDSARAPFTKGFIDRAQWKALRSVALDNTLYQAVVLMEHPLLTPFAAPPISYIPDINLPAGSIYPWSPTLTDLDVFLQYWVDWVQRTRAASANTESRSVFFVSRHRVPFVTTFQDLKTGVKLHQMCVGDYCVGDAPQIDLSGLVMRGKIGTIRYVHRISDNVNVRAESFGVEAIRTITEGPAGARGSEAISADSDALSYVKENNGYAELKLLLDTWKPTGVWSNVHADAMENGVLAGVAAPDMTAEMEALLSDQQRAILGRIREKRLQPSTLVLGPVLGMPRLLTDLSAEAGMQHVMLPVMIEIDNDAVLTATVVGLFDGVRTMLNLGPVRGRVPFFFEVGPVHLHDRYRVVIGGIKGSPFASFAFCTHSSVAETNVVVLNCDTSADALAASLLMTDLRDRCAVPFGGLVALVHTEFQPDVAAAIQELQRNRVLALGLAEYRRSQAVTGKLRQEALGIAESFREMWRVVFSKPSYRELLKAGFNIFMTPLTAPEELPVDDAERKASATVRFLALLAERLRQEYVDRLRFPYVNVFRAMVVEPASHPLVPQDNVYAPVPGGTAENGRLLELILENQGPCAPMTGGPPLRVSVVWSDPDEELLDAVLKLWLRGCRPAPAKFPTWTSANGHVSIEQLPYVTEKSIASVEARVSAPAEAPPSPEAPSSPEVRVFIVNGGGEQRVEEAALLVDSLAAPTQRFWRALSAWKAQAKQREYCVVCPSTSHGSKLVEVSVPAAGGGEAFTDVFVHMVDSIYRSCEFERRYQLAELEKRMPKKKLQAAAARSKRAQKKKEDEERQQREAIQREVDALLAAQVPDGYLLLRCVTQQVTQTVPAPTPAIETDGAGGAGGPGGGGGGGDDNPNGAAAAPQTDQPAQSAASPRGDIPSAAPTPIGDPTSDQARPLGEVTVTDLITQVAAHFIGDKVLLDFLVAQEQLPIDAAALPAKYDLLQLPQWVERFCPNKPTLFAEDEVVFVARQNSQTKVVLRVLDLRELQSTLVRLYERSRLSDLSRPADLREVDFTIEGVRSLFFKDLLQSIWLEALDATQRETMLDITDDFVRSYCFAHCMGDPDVSFASAQTFAKAVQVGLRCSLEMRTALTMSRSKRFEYLLRATEEAEQTVAEQEAKERRIARLQDIKRAEWQARVSAERLLQALGDRLEAERSPQKARSRSMQAKGKKGLASEPEPEAEPEPDEIPAEVLELTEEELQEVMGAEQYDSDLDDLQKELVGAKQYSLPKTLREQAAVEDAEVKQKAQQAAAERSNGDFEGEIDEEVMAQLVQQRAAWLLEVVPRVVDNVLDAVMEELADRGAAQLLRDLCQFGAPPPSEDERRAAAGRRLQRLSQERFRERQARGVNATKFI